MASGELNVAPGLAVVILCILYKIYVEFFKRISNANDLKSHDYCGKKLSGVVVKVLDGDGFEFLHTPPLRTTVYLPGDETLPVRLAGIDAPEMPGKLPGQPFARESKEYLTNLILRKQITIYVYGFDQYGRILAEAHVPSGLFHSVNVNLDLVEKGFACVYTGRDAKYGDSFSTLRRLESEAKYRNVGMWRHSNITPMEHKRRYRTYQF